MICSQCGNECGTDKFCTVCGQPATRGTGGYDAYEPYQPTSDYPAGQPWEPAGQPKKVRFPLWAGFAVGWAVFGVVVGLATQNVWDALMALVMLSIPFYLVAALVVALRRKYVVPYLVPLIVAFVLLVFCAACMPESEYEDEEDLPALSNSQAAFLLVNEERDV